MAKKDIGKILTTGTARQRVLLLSEAEARNKYFQDRLLTNNEFTQLINSFKKPNEIKLWNEFKSLDKTVANAITNLQGLLFDVLRNYSNLRGYILLWQSIENAEHLVNYVLHEIKDPKERKKVANKGANDVYFLFCKNEIDQEGYLDIQVNFEENEIEENGKRKPEKPKEYALWNVMNNVKKEVEASVIRYLSWERATLDYMEENGFNIRTYKLQIKDITKKLNTPIIGWDKYSGKRDRNRPHPVLDKLINKYAICPNMDEMKVDEKEYHWFRRYFLDGEDYPDELRGKVNKSLSYE